MRRALTLRYLGTSTGYAAATYVYGPDTTVDVQLAAARAYVAGIVSGSGSGYSSKVELWTENFPIKRWIARYPNNLGKY